MEKCQKSFDELKQFLSSLPLLTKPNTDDELLMYVATTSEAVSLVLIREEGKMQKPIYYISRVLCDAETRYSRIEKVILAIIATIHRLRPYFQAYSVKVLTDLLLRTPLQQPD